MNVKSERLKKLETELEDLEQWKKLGLVPKKDVKKHDEEIKAVKQRIKEEKERLALLKENGELEEYIAPKRSSKQPYQEPQTLPDLTMGVDNMTDIGFDVEDGYEETSSDETVVDEDATLADVDEDDPFSDKKPLEKRYFRRSRCRQLVISAFIFISPFVRKNALIAIFIRSILKKRL